MFDKKSRKFFTILKFWAQTEIEQRLYSCLQRITPQNRLSQTVSKLCLDKRKRIRGRCPFGKNSRNFFQKPWGLSRMFLRQKGDSGILPGFRQISW